MTVLSTPVIPSNVSRGRYRATTDGEVFDTWGRYYISRELWDSWVLEGRSDRYDHDFVLGSDLVEDGIDRQWRRTAATCSRCGERRKVFWAVSLDDLNHGWCVAPPAKSWLKRLFA